MTDAPAWSIGPAGLKRPALVLVSAALIMAVIARTTGAGWLLVILSAAVPVLTAGVIWPLLAVRRVTVEVRAPAVSVVGRATPVTIAVRGTGQGIKARLVEPVSEWRVAHPPVVGEVMATPTRRGILRAVTVELVCAGPLGILAWRRQGRVALARPLEVGPRPIATAYEERWAGHPALVEGTPRGRIGADTVRGVREYVPGDATRLVHWPITARWGEPMVKELEDPERAGLALVVDLRGPIDEAEAAAGRAAGLAEAALRAGAPVTMLTAEVAGPRVGPVNSPTDIARRLARAVAGPPAEGPLPPGSDVVRVASQAP